MKHLVNGEEWEPGAPVGVEVSSLPDRLSVRTAIGTATALAVRSGAVVYVSYRGRSYKVERAVRRRGATGGDSTGEATAPMPGQIVEVSCQVGDTVAQGDRLLVLEAMKMQQPIVAPCAGVVDQLKVAQGDQVTDGQVLAVVKPE